MVGEGFRAGTTAGHAGRVRRRASRVPASRDCHVQTGQVDSGGSEPVLWAVVSAPHSTPIPLHFQLLGWAVAQQYFHSNVEGEFIGGEWMY